MVMSMSAAEIESTTFVLEDEEMVMNVASGETTSYYLDLGGDAPVFSTTNFESWDWDQDVWYRVDVWDEINKTLKGATVTTGDGFGTTCAEPSVPNGTYYCALPFNHNPSDVKVELEGFVTKVYDDALVYKNVPPPYNATLVRYTMKVVVHDELNLTFPLDGTLANGKVTASSGAIVNYVNSVAYVATTVANTFTLERTGYLTTTSASASPLSNTEQVVVTFGTNGTTCTTNASLRCDQSVKYTFKVSFYGCSRRPQDGANVSVVNGTTLYATAVNEDGTAHYYLPVDPTLDDHHPLDVKFDDYHFDNNLGNGTVNNSAQYTMEYDFQDMWGGCGSGSSSSSSSTTSGGTTGGAVVGGGGGDGGGALTDTFEVTCPAVTVLAGGRAGATCTFRQLEGSTPYLDGTAGTAGYITVEPTSFSVDRLYYYDPGLGDYTNVREVALNVSAEGLDRCTDSVASVIVNASFDTRSGPLFNDTVLPVTVMSHEECHVCGDGACTGRESVDACPEDCAVCGDGACSPGEDLAACPDDCGVCGDGSCSEGENVTACPGDCTVCGDGQCSPGEDAEKCPDDCTQCGDGQCTGDETLGTCPGDCARCGDGTCSSGEALATCPEDCSVCGDGQCAGGEDAASCPDDCSVCGDGQCTGKESTTTCCVDCGCDENMTCDAELSLCRALPTCGDGTCDLAETAASCPEDCATCGDSVCSADEGTATCCADCPCAEGTCNPVLNTCVTTTCGDDTCEAGEGITCPEDCAWCGDGTCDAGEDCCTDCGCFGDEECDQLTVSCVTVTDEKTLTFDHSTPAGADGTPSSTEEQEAHEREMTRTVEEVAALVTRARAGTGTAADTGELASQVRSMVERSVEASREVASRRAVTVKDTSAGYRSTVELEVENTGTTFRRDVRIVESIPKDVAGDVSQLVFERQPDMIIKADPVVAWTVDIPPGETVVFTYSVARDLRTVTSYERPVVLVEEVQCGNMVCEPSEDPGTCPQDCPCGNGVCDTERRCLTLGGGATTCQEPETCATCAADCGCDASSVCIDEQCIDASVCGDGQCIGDEDKATCCDDCGCPANEVCREGGCARVETAASGIPSVLLLAGILVLMMVTSGLSSLSLRRGPTPEAPVLPPDLDEVPAGAVAPAHEAMAVSAGVVIDEGGAVLTAGPLAVGEVLAQGAQAGVAMAAEAEQRAVGFTLAPEEQDLPPGFIDVLELKAEAVEEALHNHRAGELDFQGNVAWCMAFFETYQHIERRWMFNLLRLSGLEERVIETAERQWIKGEADDTITKQEDARAAFEGNVEQIVAYLEAHPSAERGLLLDMLRSTGYSDAEIDEGVRRLFVRQGADSGGVIL